MAERPRRKWLQVHLSTAVLMMFAAGGLIWLNVKTERVERISFAFGWPLKAMKSTKWIVTDTVKVRDEGLITERRWHINFLIVDVLTALAILFAVWFVCERWIAWRAGRKKE